VWLICFCFGKLGGAGGDLSERGVVAAAPAAGSSWSSSSSSSTFFFGHLFFDPFPSFLSLPSSPQFSSAPFEIKSFCLLLVL
jgi:hypothetical protein